MTDPSRPFRMRALAVALAPCCQPTTASVRVPDADGVLRRRWPLDPILQAPSQRYRVAPRRADGAGRRIAPKGPTPDIALVAIGASTPSPVRFDPASSAGKLKVRQP